MLDKGLTLIFFMFQISCYIQETLTLNNHIRGCQLGVDQNLLFSNQLSKGESGKVGELGQEWENVQLGHLSREPLWVPWDPEPSILSWLPSQTPSSPGLILAHSLLSKNHAWEGTYAHRGGHFQL